MNIQHPQGVSNHKNPDDKKEDCPHQGCELENRSKGTQQRSQQGVGSQFCGEKENDWESKTGICMVLRFYSPGSQIRLNLISQGGGEQPALNSQAG